MCGHLNVRYHGRLDANYHCDVDTVEHLERIDSASRGAVAGLPVWSVFLQFHRLLVEVGVDLAERAEFHTAVFWR